MSGSRRATLFIESAIAGGSLAVSARGETFGAPRAAGNSSRSEDLLLAIERFLRETGINKSDLDQVVVSRGPGSFTGLRIGIAVALGLADGLQIPCAGAEIAAALISQLSVGDGDLVALPFGKRDLAVIHGAEPAKWKSVPASRLEGELGDDIARVFVHQDIRDLVTAAGSRKICEIGPNLALLIAEAHQTGAIDLSVTEPIYLSAAALQS